jgi:Cu(I)/Ag(I) efflux system membrane fusion protein
MNLKIVLFFLAVFFVACSGGERETETGNHAHRQVEKYTCSMHPQIIQDKPGTCPICGMALVKISAAASSAHDLMLNDTQIRLANITTQIINRKSIGETITINARVVTDEQERQVISSRASGRIEKLFIKETGQPIRQGQPLYTLFSETLLTLQQEYVLAKEQYEILGNKEERYRSFFESAEKKLRLYGLTKEQIHQLTTGKTLHPSVTFVSPASGTVTSLNVSEGQYVDEGALLFKLEDISKLWIEADLYPDETLLVKTGDLVRVQIANGEPQDVRISFLSPEFARGSQIMKMRAVLNNPGLKFKPGQQAEVYLTHSAHEAVTLPADAVIRDEHGSHIYLQTAMNTFEPRKVKTGAETTTAVEITEGLHEGDTVVVSGAYLLYSELILKKGLDPMALMEHK